MVMNYTKYGIFISYNKTGLPGDSASQGWRVSLTVRLVGCCNIHTVVKCPALINRAN